MDLTRRGFLVQTSVAGVGIASGLGMRQVFQDAQSSAASSSTPMASQAVPVSTFPAVSLAGPMVLHIRDVATAEISMMVGTQEMIYRDPELVTRVLKSATSATTKQAEG